jgi:hypothetical protein
VLGGKGRKHMGKNKRRTKGKLYKEIRSNEKAKFDVMKVYRA